MTVRAVEGKNLWTGGKGINVDRENKIISLKLRDENNLIIRDQGDNEIYVDLQLPDELRPTDAFPVGITTGRAIVDNGWDWQGTIVCFKTTSGDNIKLFYTDDGKLYIDNGTGTFKQIYLKGEVDALLQALRDYVDQQLALKQDILIAGDRITIDADGVTINADLQVSDTAYGPSWDGVTEIAPSKNAVYDKISSMISNDTYGPGWDADATHAPSKNSVYDKIHSIDVLIPNAAAANNQLADKNYVDDSINQVAAYYITKNAQGDAFATYAELSSASTFYSGGVVRTPTRNDFCIVLADETHSGEATRYTYQNSQWEYQYTINESPMTQAQLDAINSGITANKVSTYDGYANAIAGKQDALALPTTPTQGNLVVRGANNKTLADGGAIPTVPTNVSAFNNDAGYVTSSIINDTAYGNGWDADTTHAPTKNAVYDKISAMDSTISGKQNALTAGSNISITTSQGITTISATDTTYQEGNGIDIGSGNTINVVLEQNGGLDFSIAPIPELKVDTSIVTTHGTGSTAPATTPSYVGQEYIDSTNDKFYIAMGTSSSSDWKEIGGGVDKSWVTKTISSGAVELGIRTIVQPNANFTLNAPANGINGEEYILRCENVNSYAITLSSDFRNPLGINTTTTPQSTDQFVFLNINGVYELQQRIL